MMPGRGGSGRVKASRAGLRDLAFRLRTESGGCHQRDGCRSAGESGYALECAGREMTVLRRCRAECNPSHRACSMGRGSFDRPRPNLSPCLRNKPQRGQTLKVK